MNDAPPPPAGWYTDPDQPTLQRYWDGGEWTDHRAPGVQPSPVQQKPEALEPPDAPRRVFAAKYRHRGWGLALAILGGVEILGGVLGAPTASSPTVVVVPVVVGVALVVWSIYLLRGRGVKARAIHQGASAAEGASRVSSKPRAAAVQPIGKEFNADLQQRLTKLCALAAASDTLGEERDSRALLAWANRVGGSRGVKQVTQELAELRQRGFLSLRRPFSVITPEGYFAAASRTGKPLGSADRVGQERIEVYGEFVVQGTSVELIDAQTQAMVYLDGQEQITKRLSVSGAALGSVLPGSALLWSGLMAKDEKHDSRSAEFQVGSTSWTMQCIIPPNQVNQARATAMRINSIADSIAVKS